MKLLTIETIVRAIIFEIKLAREKSEERGKKKPAKLRRLAYDGWKLNKECSEENVHARSAPIAKIYNESRLMTHGGAAPLLHIHIYLYM